MPDVQLQVGGMIYSGWTAMRAQRSIEQAAGAFALELTERWPGQPQQWPIEPGAACALLLDGEPVITGFVDSVERSLDAHDHSIRVHGRDAAGDLVDCSALLPDDRTDDVRGQTLLGRAKMLCDPYQVTVVDETGIARNTPKRAIEPFETIWEHIERGAREMAVLIMSDGRGGIVITRAGASMNPVALVEGENVKSASLLRDDSGRFNRYIARGQSATNGSLEFYGSDASPEAKIEDTAIRKPRVLLIEADDLADGVTLKDRVRWERNVRRGQGRRLTVTVQGWSAQGRVWRPNEMVQVRLPTLGIDGQLLIVDVSQSLDLSGTLTTLTLSPREAYDLLPEKPVELGTDASGLGSTAATDALFK